MSRSVFAIEQTEERAQRLWQKRAAIEALLYGIASGPGCITQVCLHEVVPRVYSSEQKVYVIARK
jgi:hypothetical protein